MNRRRVYLCVLLAALVADSNFGIHSESRVESFDADTLPLTRHISGDSYRAKRKSVNAIPRRLILEISHRIDELASEHTDSNEGQHASVSDHVFLRRVYLDIAGRIPTYAEANEFLACREPDKRMDLVDRLLDSEAFASRQFNYYADLLRIQSRNRIGPNQPFIDYVKEAIRSNKPYDQFVHEMLTAEGAYMKRGNGAAGYLLRDYSMPEVAMSNTIRIFLGTRLECAQCHNHPTDKWTRRNYYEMVAFFGGISYRLGDTESRYDEGLEALTTDPEFSIETRRFTRQSLIPLRFGLKGSGTGLARLPEGYQYADAEEHDVVFAETLFDNVDATNKTVPEYAPPPQDSKAPQRARHHIPGVNHVGSRKVLADWLTSPNNERFATVIANRLWKQAMGAGIAEPVDNITDKSLEEQPELLSYLSRTMVVLKFDTKQLLRAIYCSRAYQSHSTQKPDNHLDVNCIPRFRRMTAEQIWDSLLSLTIDNVDQPRQLLTPLPNYLGLFDLYDSYDRLVQLTPDELREIVLKNIASRDGDPNYPRHVFRMDSRPGSNRRHLIFKELTGGELLRASDLLSPMPSNHLLRDYGQSDREAVNNGNREISTTQLLQLMNGFVEEQIANRDDSVLMQNLDAADNDTQRTEIAYLSILGRKPTDQERESWAEDFEIFGSETTSDLVWTLINSTEFLFIK